MGERGLDEQVGAHFGRVPTYTLVNTESGELKVIKNTSTHMGGSGYAPDLLHDHGVETMLCDGVGRKAIQMFEDKGIMVYIGARGTVADALDLFKAGKLKAATNETACQQHAFRGEGHGDGSHKHC